MTAELLLQHIARHIQLTAEEENYFVSLLHFKKVKKKQFIFQDGDIYSSSIFVSKGLLRLYSIDKNGFEHILQFAPPGWWMGDMHSFLKQQPGTLSVDAIEDSEIILLQKSSTEQLYNNVPKFERFFRILAENAIATYQHRLISNLSLPAAERYNTFCQLYPSLIQSLSQKYVASYIGVTPEFLSKILSAPVTKKSS